MNPGADLQIAPIPGTDSVTNFCDLDPSLQETVRTWRNHPDVRLRMFSTHEITAEEHARFLDGLREDSSKLFWLVGDLGVISLRHVNRRHRNAYLGIYKSPFCQREGASKKLMGTLLAKSFDELELHTLKLEVFSDNRRAIVFYNRCGFNQEGRLRELHLKPNGTFVDLILMGITAFEYRNDTEWI